MLNLRKNTLALAVVAAAMGGGISTAQDAQAQAVSATGLGQALIYPYYTVRDGWRTFIHVTNTSARTVAAKVRVRAAKGSEDILDFVLVLSPYDMWTGVIEERNGGPGLRPTDASCTVPYAPKLGKGNFQKFLLDNLPDSATVDDLREGYVEIIQMGVTTDEAQPVAVAANHGDNETPANCGAVVTAFGSSGTIATTRTQFIAPAGNVLAGKFDLINTSRAYAGADRALVIEDFTTVNLIYGQFDPQWNYPTLASTVAAAPAIPAAADVNAVNTALGAASISNEWVLNPGINEKSSWVVTFPTKILTAGTGAAMDTTVFTGTTTSACPPAYRAEAVRVNLDLYSREELDAVDVDVSPGPGNVFCYEVNVVNFLSDGVSSAGLLNSVVSKNIDTSILGSAFLGGWARMTHATSTPAAPVPVPWVGFNLTARSNADGDSAVLYDHVYEGRP
jgi:hypothetical protein